MSETASFIITLFIILVVAVCSIIIGEIIVKALLKKEKLAQASKNTPTEIIQHESHKVNIICDYPCKNNHNGVCQGTYIKISNDGACLTRELDVRIDMRV